MQNKLEIRFYQDSKNLKILTLVYKMLIQFRTYWILIKVPIYALF